MIRGFWVIDQGGLCLFHEAFGDEVEQDPLMLSSFMSAIFTFSKEIGQKPLELSETEEYRFVYTMRSPLLFVLAADRKEPPDVLKNSLKHIIDNFFLNYEEMVWKSFLDHQKGNSSIFETYADKLMKLLELSELKTERPRVQRESLADAFSKFVKSSKDQNL